MTRREVARELGLSYWHLSKVLGGHKPMRPEFPERFRAAIERARIEKARRLLVGPQRPAE